jgi:hypothetical protein
MEKEKESKHAALNIYFDSALSLAPWFVEDVLAIYVAEH